MFESGSSLFGDLAAGGRAILQVEHGGIVYQGELLLRDAWQPELAHVPLEQSFRIVLFGRPVSIPRPMEEEPRLACWLPSPEGHRRLEEARGSWPTVVREAQASYSPGPAPQPLLADWQRRMAEELRELEREAYASGRLVASRPISLSPTIFREVGPQEAITSLARDLLAETFRPRLDQELLPGLLAPDDVVTLYQAYLQGRQDRLSTQVRSFALALGLASPADLERLDLGQCPALDVMRGQVERGGGRVEAQPLCWAVMQEVGVPMPVAVLYLMALVRWGQFPYEISLHPDHPLNMVSGEPFDGDRITSDLVPEIAWPAYGGLGAMDSVRRPAPITWRGALPYLRLLDPNLGPPSGPAEQREQQRMLRAALATLRQGLSNVAASMARLASALGEPSPVGTESALARLRMLAGSRDWRSLYSRVQARYQEVRDDLGRYRVLVSLGEHVPEIVPVVDYLRNASCSPVDEALELDRQAFLARFQLQALIDSPGLWPDLAALFQWFQTRYAQRYREFHASYHEALSRLRHRIEEARPLAAALDRLNGVAPLGGPIGQEFVTAYRALADWPMPCTVPSFQLDFQHGPGCPQCHLYLSTPMPEEWEAGVLGGLEDALKGQMRRLSSEVVRRILTQGQETRLQQLLQIAQASDLSALANILDDEVAEFLRGFLAETLPPEPQIPA